MMEIMAGDQSTNIAMHVCIHGNKMHTTNALLRLRIRHTGIVSSATMHQIQTETLHQPIRAYFKSHDLGWPYKCLNMVAKCSFLSLCKLKNLELHLKNQTDDHNTHFKIQIGIYYLKSSSFILHNFTISTV